MSLTGRVLSGAVAASLCAALVSLPTPVKGAPSSVDPTRVLIVGDSMTQGSEGDYTWRFRLWQHFQAAGVPVDFVGPRDDIWQDSQAYADPLFDRDHASRWGMAMTFLDQPVQDLVATYHPDVVVEVLGVNDLTFLGESPEETADVLRDFVAKARQGDPDVDLVLSRLPQPWLDKVPAFNDLVDQIAAEETSASSRVVSARADEGLVRTEDTWDMFHPSATGEVKIAAAVADALAELDLGPPAQRPLPDVPRGPRIPPVLSGAPGVREVEVTWQRSPGATEYDLSLRDLTTGGGWHQVADALTDARPSAVIGDLPAWHRVQLQLAPTKGLWRAEPDAWSNVVELEVQGDSLARARPEVSVRPDGTATVEWRAVLGAAAYEVQWRPAEQPDGWRDAGSTSMTSAVVDRLTSRSQYAFRIRALRGPVTGAWSEVVASVPPVPPVRAHAVVTNTGAIRAFAAPVPAATSYTLRVATAASCSRPPGPRRFRVLAARILQPVRRFRSHGRASWVRWVAVRGEVEGAVGASSTACVRLPR